MHTNATIAVILISLCGFMGAVEATGDADTTLIQTGISCPQIPQEQWQRLIPMELKYSPASGLPLGHTNFGIDIIPITDSNDLRPDSQCNNVPRIIALFTDFSWSILTILRTTPAGLSLISRSIGHMNGRGRIELIDINGDNIREILVALLYPPHEYENVYFYALSGDSLQCLNPRTESGGYTEFTGRVAWSVTDSGLAVTAFHPTDAIRRQYYMRNNTREIRLVSEKQMEKMQR